MPRQRLGRWGRWYASTTDDFAHFTDRQFRVWANVFARAVRDEGELPKLRPLRAAEGADEIDFLISEGRLTVTPDNAVTITGWTTYQAPVDRTNADRQARFRSRTKEQEVTPLPTVDNAVTVTGVSTSTSISNVEENGVEPVAGASYPVEGSDEDALDRYYALTGSRPWGKRVGDWIGELQAQHGTTHVVAALEVEAKGGREKLVERVAVRLERQADRVARAEAKKPKPVDPVIAEQRAAYAARYGPEPVEVAPVADPAQVAAGRAAFEALRGSFASSGLPVGMGRVLPSRKNGSIGSADPALTVDEGSKGSPGYRVNGGDVLPGVQSSDRAPSPPGTGAALDPAPNRARPSRAVHSEASTDEATPKERHDA